MERVKVQLEPAAIALLTNRAYWEKFMKIAPPNDALAALRLVPASDLGGTVPIELDCQRSHAEALAAWCEAQAADMEQHEPEQRERTNGQVLERAAARFREALS